MKFNTFMRTRFPFITGGLLMSALILIGCAAETTQTNNIHRSESNLAKPAAADNHGAIAVPPSLVAEHHELHEMLAKVIALGGKTGEAARTVEQRLSEHFEKEEQYALPQLGLLKSLAAGGDTADRQKVIEMSDKLKADLPKMLDEHKGIVQALDALNEAGKSENKPEAIEFAAKLKLHAENEEDVLYPAAILVGEYLKLKAK